MKLGKSPQVTKGAAANGSSRPGRGVLLAVAGSVAGLVLLAGALLIHFIPAGRDQAAIATNAALGQSYAALFDARLLELRRQLEAASATPAIREALLSGDSAKRAEAADMLTSLLEFVARIDLFPSGQAPVDQQGRTGLPYTAIDLMTRAERGAFAGPEAIRGAALEFYAAQPVKDGESVIGVLLAVIEPRYFLIALASHDAAEGHVVVEQVYDPANPLSLLAWGDGRSEVQPFQVALSMPQWRMTFRASAQLLPGYFAAGPTVLGLIATAIAAAALALGMLSWLLIALRRGAVAEPKGVSVIADVRAAPEPEPESPAASQALRDQAGPTDEAEALPNELEVDDALEIEGADQSPQEPAALDPEIFCAAGVRGLATGSLSEDAVYWVGRAFAAQAVASGHDEIVVGRDGRRSSRALRDALIRGLVESGGTVIDIGEVPTPVLYFAMQERNTGTGIMITGSHNEPDYNGLKLFLGGEALTDERIQALRERIARGNLPSDTGHVESIDLQAEYFDRIASDVIVAMPLKVVVDCGNGVAGRFAPELVTRLDCEVVPLYCEMDGSFPNHAPDPTQPDNLEDLITVVKAEGADLGLAFDDDGDRIGVVTANGKIIWPDQLLMLFAQDLVGRNPGADIVYDVECSRHLNTVISELGGRPIMWNSGTANIRKKLKETQALLAGEFDGHISFGERWYGFEDALYTAARLLEIIGSAGESAEEIFAQFPPTVSTPELRVATTDQAKSGIVDRLAEDADFGAGALTTIDGVRVDYADGWGVVRASKVSPSLVLRFEADSDTALERIQQTFANALRQIDPALDFREPR